VIMTIMIIIGIIAIIGGLMWWFWDWIEIFCRRCDW